jgi:hypothetical protein
MPQLYMFQEMLAVFALFTGCFVIVAMVAMSLSMLRNCWKLFAARLSDIRLPVRNMESVNRENHGPTYDVPSRLFGP